MRGVTHHQRTDVEHMKRKVKAHVSEDVLRGIVVGKIVDYGGGLAKKDFALPETISIHNQEWRFFELWKPEDFESSGRWILGLRRRGKDGKHREMAVSAEDYEECLVKYLLFATRKGWITETEVLGILGLSRLDSRCRR